MTRLQEVTGEQVRQAPVKALRAIFAGVGQLLLVADRLRAEQAEGDDSAAQGSGRAGSRAPGDVAGAAAPVYPRGMAKSKRGGKSKGSAKSKGSDKGKKPGKAKGGAASKPAGASKPPKSSKPPKETKGQKGQRKNRAAEAADQRRWRSLDSTGNVRLLTDEDLAPAATKPAPAAAKPAPAAAKPAAAAAKPAPAAASPASAKAAAAATPAKPAKLSAATLPVPGYDGLSLASLRARLRNLDASQVGQLLSYERANAAREDIITMFERRIARIS